MDLLYYYLLFVTIALAIACILVLLIPNPPSILSALTLYGKSISPDPGLLVRYSSVPKRWFLHFYILAVLWTGFWLQYAIGVSYGFFSPTATMHNVLTVLTSTKPHFNWTTGILGLSLILIHVSRRMLESIYVSIFSNGTMNVAHYILGLLHYAIFPLTVVTELIGIATKEPATTLNFSLLEITLIQWIGVLCFLICNWEQDKIAHELAAVRRGPTGKVKTYDHCLLQGGWFDYVSSPHFMFEILIYLSLWLVLGVNAKTYNMFLLFVCINQLFAALNTHLWYRNNFKNYPKSRKALIPFIL